MNNLTTYSMAMVLQRGKFCCHNAAPMLNSTSHDHLSRFLSKTTPISSPYWKNLPSTGYLVIDDCVIDKRHSPQIEGVVFVYSSSDNKTLPGLCFVLLLWVSGKQSFVLDVIVCRKAFPQLRSGGKSPAEPYCLCHASLGTAEKSGLPNWTNPLPGIPLIDFKIL